MIKLSKKDKEEVFKYFMGQYKVQWDLNQYNRTEYDVDLEYYKGYRNQADYPMAYNEVFNKILPIIYSLLSRFMDQLYQSSNIVSIKPRKRQNVDGARRVEALLNYQLEALNDIDSQGGSYLTMMKWMFNTVTFGKGIVKPYWRKEERISPRRMMLYKPSFDRFGNFQGNDPVDYISQEMQTIYDGPYVEVLHNKLYVPHPLYRSPQDMPAVFCVYRRTIDEIKRKVDKGIYDKKEFSEMSWQPAGGASPHETDTFEGFAKSISIEGINYAGEDRQDRKTPEVDVIEGYGKVILKGPAYEVGSGMQIKGPEQEVIVHIGNYKALLSVQRNIYHTRPFFDMGCYYTPETYWDMGLVRLTKGLQEQTNNLGNLRMQNAMMLINQMLKVNANSDIDPEHLVWRPFGLVPVDDMEDVQPLIVPDTNSNIFQEQEQFYDKTIQDITGMYDYGMGRTPQRQERVGVVYGIQSMGEARAKLMLMSMDYLGIRPLLKYMMILNTFHLPSGFEYRITERDQNSFGNIFAGDLHPDFDYAARYTAMEPALGKQARADRLVQMAGLWQQNPWINQYQMTKVIMELMDIMESDTLLKTPQQFMQEMQQQQQQQMQAQLGMMQKQAQLKEREIKTKAAVDAQAKLLTEGRRIKAETQKELTEGAQDFQSDHMLAEQDFRHEKALLAIQEEASKNA